MGARVIEPPVRLFWDPDLQKTDAYYCPDPPGIGLSPTRLARKSRAEQRECLLEEIGHHLTQCLYDPMDTSFAGLCQRRWCEAKSERAGMRWWVSDEEVEAALSLGCSACWEFALLWGVTPSWARRRVAMWRAGRRRRRAA